MSESALRQRLEENVRAVRQRMELACQRVQRPVNAVRLVAVTKYAQPAWMRELFSLGELDWGENRPQQLASRAGEFPETVRWHLIGTLQRNKAQLAARHAAVVHSVDSVRLLETLEKQAATSQRTLPVLLEVNISGEAQKHGFTPAELLAVAGAPPATPHLSIEGLMTMAPHSDLPEESRGVFRGLRELRDSLREQVPAWPLRDLSMGMSGDFEVAIEEGATLVRVGSALWEGLETLSPQSLNQ